MTPEPNRTAPTPGELNLPPEWDDPPPPTEEEMRAMEASGLTMDDLIRVIEAEFGTGEG